MAAMAAAAAWPAAAQLAAGPDANRVISGGMTAWPDYLRQGAGLAAGYVTIRNVAAGTCLAMGFGAAGTVQPHLAQGSCEAPMPIFVMAEGDGRHSLRPVRLPAGESGCAMAARGVVLGDPRLDVGYCEGSADQLFTLDWWDGPDNAFGVPAEERRRRDGGRKLVKIRQGPLCAQASGPASPAPGQPTTGFQTPASRGQDVKLVRCADVPAQLWELAYAPDLSAMMQIAPRPSRAWSSLWAAYALAEARGWRPVAAATPDMAAYGLSAAPMRRALAVRGVDLPGGGYWNGAAVADDGRGCAMLCVRDERCRAFTWHAGSSRRGAAVAPRCWLKGTVPGPVANASTASGVVRP